MLQFSDAYRLRCLPLALIRNRFGGESLVALVPREFTHEEVLELKYLTQREVILETEDAAVLERTILASYLGGDGAIGEKVRFVADVAKKPTRVEAIDLSADKPVPSLLEAILYRALYLSASDVHLEPHEQGIRLRFRIDGRLRDEREFNVTREVAQELTRRIRILAALDITDMKKPADGSFSLKTGSVVARVRVSIVPAFHGDKIVLRFLESDAGDTEQSLSSLGLGARDAAIFSSALQQERGAILLSGPTGSGKSTLLYTALRRIASEQKNIVTIEDPVERIIPGVTQISVDKERGLDFKSLFEKVLRQDPDVVMLGEIRDEQTANVALTASITGHLLLSTVHAGNVLEVVLRLQGLGVTGDLLSAAIKLIVSQRLVPLACKRCAVSEKAPLNVSRFFRFDEAQTVVSSAGCSHCSETGVQGRVGVFELLPIGSNLREILASVSPQAGPGALRAFGEAAFKEGYQPLGVRVRELLLAGEISLQTATRVLGVEL